MERSQCLCSESKPFTDLLLACVLLLLLRLLLILFHLSVLIILDGLGGLGGACRFVADED